MTSCSWTRTGQDCGVAVWEWTRIWPSLNGFWGKKGKNNFGVLVLGIWGLLLFLRDLNILLELGFVKAGFGINKLNKNGIESSFRICFQCAEEYRDAEGGGQRGHVALGRRAQFPVSYRPCHEAVVQNRL
jgi:hypothetical protein